MIDLQVRITDAVVDAVRHLGVFAATRDMTEISKCRGIIRKISSHELCGIAATIGGANAQNAACEHRCMEISLPLWDVTLYVQRALTLGLEPDDDET